MCTLDSHKKNSPFSFSITIKIKWKLISPFSSDFYSFGFVKCRASVGEGKEFDSPSLSSVFDLFEIVSRRKDQKHAKFASVLFVPDYFLVRSKLEESNFQNSGPSIYGYVKLWNDGKAQVYGEKVTGKVEKSERNNKSRTKVPDTCAYEKRTE